VKLNSPVSVKSTSSAPIPHSIGRFRDKAHERKVRPHYPFISCTSCRMCENEKLYMARSYSDFRVAYECPRVSCCCQPLYKQLRNFSSPNGLSVTLKKHLILRHRVFVFIIRAGQGRRHWQMPEPPEKSQRLPYGQRMETTVDILSFTIPAYLPARSGLTGTVPPVQ